jgi:hypothetical protein
VERFGRAQYQSLPRIRSEKHHPRHFCLAGTQRKSSNTRILTVTYKSTSRQHTGCRDFVSCDIRAYLPCSHFFVRSLRRVIRRCCIDYHHIGNSISIVMCNNQQLIKICLNSGHEGRIREHWDNHRVQISCATRIIDLRSEIDASRDSLLTLQNASLVLYMSILLLVKTP